MTPIGIALNVSDAVSKYGIMDMPDLEYTSEIAKMPGSSNRQVTSARRPADAPPNCSVFAGMSCLSAPRLA